MIRSMEYGTNRRGQGTVLIGIPRGDDTIVKRRSSAYTSNNHPMTNRFPRASVEVLNEWMNNGCDEFKSSETFHKEKTLLQTDVIQMLLNRTTDDSVTDHVQHPVLDTLLRKRYCRLDVIKLVLEHGVDIDRKNKSGQIPLQQALKICCLKRDYNSLEIIKIIIKFTVLYSQRFKGLTEEILKKVILNLVCPFRKYRYFDALISYMNECIHEVFHMKSVKLNGGVSLYEFLNQEYCARKITWGKTNVNDRARCLLKVLYHYQFPLYNDIIFSKIGKQNLLYFLSDQPMYTLTKTVLTDKLALMEKPVNLDYYSIFQISKYLSNDDLLNLAVAYVKT